MPAKNYQRQRTESHHNISTLDNTTLVPAITQHAHLTSVPASRKSTGLSALGDHSYTTSSGLDPPISYSSDFSQSIETKDLPAKIKKVISHGLRQSSRANYTSYHRRWLLFARSKSFNPYMPSVSNVLLFLDWVFNPSLMTPKHLLKIHASLKWVVNSTHHTVLENVLVPRYIAGLFNLHPPPPRRMRDVWDVNIVLDYWDQALPNEDLHCMLLSQKVVTLILISTMCRRAEIMAMTTDYYFEPNAMVFPLGVLPKTYNISSKSDDVRFVKIRNFRLNNQICPLRAVQHYIKRTVMLHQNDSGKLFITTQSPYRPAAPMTIRHWILTAMSSAGVDISIYSAKTTCHASSSKAYFAGISVDLVMRRAGWKNISSFVMHYNLPIKDIDSDDASPTTSPAPVVSRPRGRLITATQFKNSYNDTARHLLAKAHLSKFKSAVQFQSQAFVDTNPPAPRVQLPGLVRVQMHQTTSNRFHERKSPYTMYSSNIAVSHLPKELETVPDSWLHPTPVHSDDSLSSTE